MRAPLNGRLLAGGAAILAALLAANGCQKVVSIDLNNAAPHIVVEGIVTDQAQPDTVYVTKSGDYFTPSLDFPPVSHALVRIANDAGSVDTLKEVMPGEYVTNAAIGVPGRTYTLHVDAEGESYEAVSSMPPVVALDSLYVLPRREFDGDRGYDIYLLFKDPPEVANYYRIDFTVSPPLPPDSIGGRRFRLYTDKLTNGNQEVVRIRVGRSVVAGDTVQISLLSIDKAAYDYFRTVNDILSSDRSATSLSPANPNTNLTNNALGYFAAYSSSTKSIVLK